MDVNSFDQNRQTISSPALRDVLGNPSDERWAAYRKSVGIEGRRKTLTEYETVLLCVRKHWRQMCKVTNTPYKQDPDIFDLESIVNKILANYSDADLFSQTIRFVTGDDLSIDQLRSQIALTSGKYLSEKTIRRRCQELGIVCSRKRPFKRREVKQLIKRIETT